MRVMFMATIGFCLKGKNCVACTVAQKLVEIVCKVILCIFMVKVRVSGLE